LLVSTDELHEYDLSLEGYLNHDSETIPCDIENSPAASEDARGSEMQL